MPVELQIIRAAEFVRLNAQGHLNLEASKDVLTTLARACWKRGLTSALLDLRAVPVPDKPLFTSEEISALVDAFCATGFTKKQRLAVLYQTDRHGGARMFAFLSRNRGLQVQAFPDFEGALLWISAAQDELTKPARKGQAIPIKFAGAKGEAKPGTSRSGARRA
jgi:hypothetical protein